MGDYLLETAVSIAILIRDQVLFERRKMALVKIFFVLTLVCSSAISSNVRFKNKFRWVSSFLLHCNVTLNKVTGLISCPFHGVVHNGTVSFSNHEIIALDKLERKWLFPFLCTFRLTVSRLNSNEADAIAFLEQYDSEYGPLLNDYTIASWNYETNLTTFNALAVVRIF